MNKEIHFECCCCLFWVCCCWDVCCCCPCCSIKQRGSNRNVKDKYTAGCWFWAAGALAGLLAACSLAIWSVEERMSQGSKGSKRKKWNTQSHIVIVDFHINCTYPADKSTWSMIKLHTNVKRTRNSCCRNWTNKKVFKNFLSIAFSISHQLFSYRNWSIGKWRHSRREDSREIIISGRQAVFEENSYTFFIEICNAKEWNGYDVSYLL